MPKGPFYYARLASRADKSNPKKTVYDGAITFASNGWPHQKDSELVHVWDCTSYEEARDELLGYMEDYPGQELIMPEELAQFMGEA
jgi:hypothetical protein